ncbi:hypothetical protein WB403_50370, partial [Streptomyces brasiliscabiei]
GDAIDDADRLGDVDLFHRWNRAQAEERALLLVASHPVDLGAGEAGGWHIGLPDLASRLRAAMPLAIGAPDDELLRALIEEHAARRGLV